MQVRVSDEGRFLGCSGYPACRYTLDLRNPDKPMPPAEEFAEGETCELCGGRMKILTKGKNKFLGCENYPKCKNTRAILSDQIKQWAAETACPQCGKKPLEPKSGRYGEYLRCPSCDVNYSLFKLGLKEGRQGKQGESDASAPPIDIPCPECGEAKLQRKNGRFGPYYHCGACKANISEKKLLQAKGGSSNG